MAEQTHLAERLIERLVALPDVTDDCERLAGMLEALLILGLAVSVVGVLMIPSPGPGYLVLALGIAIVAGSGTALRRQGR
jgi:hypothetical protein